MNSLDSHLLTSLENDGWTIVKNAMSPEEVAKARSYFWDWLESLGIDRNNLDTWSDDNWPGDVETGFIASHGISQSQCAWYVRSRPKIREAFSTIWEKSTSTKTRSKPNTDAPLLCSMDAVICWRPWWLCDFEDWKPTVEGLHIDQNPIDKKGFWCVQGMVPLYDVTSITGGLQVVPRSHLPHVQELLEKYCPSGGDFCLMPDEAIKETVKSVHGTPNSCATLVEAKAGDLILWDSRLIHGGKVGCGLPDFVYSNRDDDEDEDDKGVSDDDHVNKPKFPRLNYTPDLTRLAVPVCMMPRAGVDASVLSDRLVAFQKGYTMNHWANEINITPSFDSHGTNISREPPIYHLSTDEELLL